MNLKILFSLFLLVVFIDLAFAWGTGDACDSSGCDGMSFNCDCSEAEICQRVNVYGTILYCPGGCDNDECGGGCECSRDRDCHSWEVCDGCDCIREPVCECDRDWDCGSGYRCDGCDCVRHCGSYNRCYTDGDVWRYDSCTSRWLYEVDNCSSGTSYGAWRCAGGNTRKERTITSGGCSGGSCGSTSTERVNCTYGCSSRKCQPSASFTVNPNPSSASDELTLNGSASRDSYGGTKLKYEWFYDNVKIGEGKTFTYIPASGSLHNVRLDVTSQGMTSHTEDNGTKDSHRRQRNKGLLHKSNNSPRRTSTSNQRTRLLHCSLHCNRN